MRRFFACAVVTVVALLSSGGCQRKAEVEIGFVVTTLANPYFVSMAEAAKRETQKHPGVQIILQAPESATDAERQMQIIDSLIARKVAALCVVPADSRSIVRVIGRANQAGIPFIVLDNRADPGAVDNAKAVIAAFIGSDNVFGGSLAGNFMAQSLQRKGKVAVLEGVSGVEAAEQRKRGFLDALKAHTGLSVVASQAANWDREMALNATQAILLANPDLNGIFAANDEMALGAAQAVHARGGSAITVVGFDAIDEALSAVESGTLAATVAQLPAEVGRLGVQTAVEAVAGRKHASELAVPVKLITKENVVAFRETR